jgi:Ohr subfamily peroxiredoxin
MPTPIRCLHTAAATAVGGREGYVVTDDRRLDLDLDTPAEMGGSGKAGTTPEQLFAAAYAASFQCELLRLADAWQLDLSGIRVHARVGIGPASEGGLGLTVVLDLEARQFRAENAAALMASAHELCPYSRATRGNIDVTLTVAGRPIERSAA